MHKLYNWYFLPKQELINGDILLSDTLYSFTQQKVLKIVKNGNTYVINDKFIVEKNNIDSFFKEANRYIAQMDFLDSKL